MLSRDMIGVEMADLWTLVGANCTLVERGEVESWSLENRIQPKLKHDVAVPRDHVDYTRYSVPGYLVYLVRFVMHVFLLPTRCSVT
jgi:hypothetical protein